MVVFVNWSVDHCKSPYVDRIILMKCNHYCVREEELVLLSLDIAACKECLRPGLKALGGGGKRSNTDTTETEAEGLTVKKDVLPGEPRPQLWEVGAMLPRWILPCNLKRMVGAH